MLTVQVYRKIIKAKDGAHKHNTYAPGEISYQYRNKCSAQNLVGRLYWGHGDWKKKCDELSGAHGISNN